MFDAFIQFLLLLFLEILFNTDLAFRYKFNIRIFDFCKIVLDFLKHPTVQSKGS